jgi:hypothetical protein
MLRWIMPCLVAVFAIGTADASDGPKTDKPEITKPEATKPEGTKPEATKLGTTKPVATRRATVRAASQLPPGLPRAHYKYRTTVAPAAPLYVRQGRQLVVTSEPAPELLITPAEVVIDTPFVNGTPWLPGSRTLPGYYGNDRSYSYDGPYYGGDTFGPYWSRLPYACGVFGYC